jgi:hypothetical protein
MNDVKQTPSSTSAASSLPVWQRMALLAVAALAIAVVYDALFLRMFSHWWFEDDPGQFAFVRRIANPISFFTDLRVIKGFGGGGAIVPFQAVSEWIDSSIAYRSVRFATWHNAVSLALILFLFFHILRRFAFTTGATVILVGLWLCLPATIAVNEFLSTRHYLEGFAAGLLAIIVAQSLAIGSWPENWKSIAVLSIATAHALLYKEVFAIATPVFLAFYLGAYGRRHAAAAILVVLGLFFAYRFWVFGANVSYGLPFLGPSDYLRFLGRMPYIMVGNFGGYLLIALICVAFMASYRHRPIPLFTIAGGLFLLAAELAVIYPISFSINQDWLQRGTWDRGLFVLSTTLLLIGGYLVARMQFTKRNVLVVILAFSVLIPGAVRATQSWHRVMIRYKREGKFYLEHPDRLLYSELPARWYFGGLIGLYDIPVRHHVLVAERNRISRKEIERFSTIWRFADGKFVPDPILYVELLNNPADADSNPRP